MNEALITTEVNDDNGQDQTLTALQVDVGPTPATIGVEVVSQVAEIGDEIISLDSVKSLLDGLKDKSLDQLFELFRILQIHLDHVDQIDEWQVLEKEEQRLKGEIALNNGLYEQLELELYKACDAVIKAQKSSNPRTYVSRWSVMTSDDPECKRILLEQKTVNGKIQLNNQLVGRVQYNKRQIKKEVLRMVSRVKKAIEDFAGFEEGRSLERLYVPKNREKKSVIIGRGRPAALHELRQNPKKAVSDFRLTDDKNDLNRAVAVARLQEIILARVRHQIFGIGRLKDAGKTLDRAGNVLNYSGRQTIENAIDPEFPVTLQFREMQSSQVGVFKKLMRGTFANFDIHANTLGKEQLFVSNGVIAGRMLFFGEDRKKNPRDIGTANILERHVSRYQGEHVGKKKMRRLRNQSKQKNPDTGFLISCTEEHKPMMEVALSDATESFKLLRREVQVLIDLAREITKMNSLPDEFEPEKEKLRTILDKRHHGKHLKLAILNDPRLMMLVSRVNRRYVFPDTDSKAA